MRTTLFVFIALIPWSLTAAPQLQPKPDAPYFEKFQPIQAPASSKKWLKKDDRLAICGDSITEQKKYSRLMEDYLTMCVPQLNVSVRQYGWGGETVPGFLHRMTNDCLRFQPTIATTVYGMNDFHYCPYEEWIGHAYATNSQRMVDIFKAHDIRVILGSPGDVSKTPWWVKTADGTPNDLNASLCQLRNLDIDLAHQEKVGFADIFWPMLVAGYLGHQQYGTNYAIPGNDGVHPNWAGHTIMAYALLHAMGLNGDIGTFTVNLKHNKIKVSAGHQVISAQDGTFTIVSTRYPFCPCVAAADSTAGYPVYGQDDVSSDNSIRSGMTFVPFNQDLNRLMLVVKNGNAARYQITWGDQNKTFSAEQLAQGINLAVEFPLNPFSSAFAKVDAAIAVKQAYETEEVKNVFRNTGDAHPTMKQITAHTDQILAEAEKQHATDVAAVQAAFVPVTHVIKITAE